MLLALEFGFFLVSPRLLLDLPFAWRDLIPGAAVCTGAGVIVHAVAVLFLRNWFASTAVPTTASVSAWHCAHSSVSSPPSGYGSPP